MSCYSWRGAGWPWRSVPVEQGWCPVLATQFGLELALEASRWVSHSGEPRVRRGKRGGALNVVAHRGSHAVALRITMGWLDGCISTPGCTRIQNTYVRTNRIRREPATKIKEGKLSSAFPDTRCPASIASCLGVLDSVRIRCLHCREPAS